MKLSVSEEKDRCNELVQELKNLMIEKEVAFSQRSSKM